ncbi:hypothetical protein [Brevundimonas naejangsanensis]
MRAVLLIGAAFFLAGCSREQPAYEAGNGVMECAKGFDALLSEIKGKRSIISDEYALGSSIYRDDQKARLYIVTRPDHPAHPAIFLKLTTVSGAGISVLSNGCGYGDADAFNQEMLIYNAYDKVLNEELPCFECAPDKRVSPSVIRRIPAPSSPPSH